MTTPRMSIDTVKKAESLINQRAWIVGAKWDHVVENYRCLVPGGAIPRNLEPADDELQRAIEEFRKRKLDAVDAQLRELGVEPTEQESSD